MFGRPGSSSLFEAFFRDPLFPNDPLFTSRPRDLSDVQYDSGMPSRARQSTVPHQHPMPGLTITEMHEEECSSDDEEERHHPLVEEPEDTELEKAANRRRWEAQTGGRQDSSIPVHHASPPQGYVFPSSSSYMRQGASPEILHETTSARRNQVHTGRSNPATSSSTLHDMVDAHFSEFERNWMHRHGNSFQHPQSLFGSPFFWDTDLMWRRGMFTEVPERGRRIHIE
ncbi:g10317 [Coccomyxa elongata]